MLNDYQQQALLRVAQTAAEFIDNGASGPRGQVRFEQQYVDELHAALMAARDEDIELDMES